MKLSITYTIFAILSTIANIGSQDLSLRIYSGIYSVLISVVIGTGVGLVVKYVLDKRYIFRYLTRDALHNTKTFMLYTVMGVLTTFVFWGFEFGFDYIFQSKEMRYLGGVIGLAIGYLIKYQLDKHFVFTD
jgi:putative flippase GtrA